MHTLLGQVALRCSTIRLQKKKVLNDKKHTWAVKKKNEIVKFNFKALKIFLPFENGPV